MHLTVSLRTNKDISYKFIDGFIYQENSAPNRFTAFLTHNDGNTLRFETDYYSWEDKKVEGSYTVSIPEGYQEAEDSDF